MLARAAATFQQVQTMPSPRCIKTHLPVPMLPPRLLDTCKVVFVCRDPRDCCASYYNHETMIPFHGFTGDFASFAEYFREGKLIFGNYWYHLEVHQFAQQERSHSQTKQTPLPALLEQPSPPERAASLVRGHEEGPHPGHQEDGKAAREAPHRAKGGGKFPQ